MLGKGTKIYSIVTTKCPRCHEGEMFRTPLRQGKLYDMYDRCPLCNQDFQIEPGFYWGSMFVAYAYSSGALLIVAGLSLLVFDLSLEWSIGLVLLTAMFGWVFNARLSRSTWINFFVRYDKNWRAANAQKQAQNKA